MVEGKIKFFNETKGFGFITCDEGEIFVHVTKIKDDVVPKTDDDVSFDIIETDRGKQADNVQIQ